MRADGFDLPFARVRPLIGMGGAPMLDTLVLGFGSASDRGKALLERRKSVFLERYLETIRPFAQAAELVAYLHARGVRCVVASAGSPEEREPLLALCGAARYFDHAIEPDEIAASKPEPDIIVAALRWGRLRARDAVMIGDTRFDIAAAHRAGVRAIALRAGGAPPADLVSADAAYDDPAALLHALHDASLGSLLARAATPREE
ncbi:MAG: hypothetical protein NVS1B2_21960 [Vulcanimicrobiaceae bacterium]